MKKFYVDIPYCIGGWGAASHCHRITLAENALEAILKSPYAVLKEGAQAIPVPEEMQEMDDEEILKHYERLHKDYGTGIA